MRRDELLLYFERELRFIRRQATHFAEKYPQIASRLQLEPTKCEDPHVERLIEAFAMLTARVQLRLDDDFSEISDALLGILYPHYLKPIPSMTIVQASMDADTSVRGGLVVERGALLHSRPVGGVRCTFRTAYPLRLFPLVVSGVDVVTTTAVRNMVPDTVRSALRIQFKTESGTPVSELGLEELRIFLDATAGDIHTLYEVFLRDPQGMLVRRGEKDGSATFVASDQIKPVGYDADEGLLEYPAESFLGYRLLQEYFTFPDKFLFVDLAGLGPALAGNTSDHFEIMVLLSQSVPQLDVRVEPSNLRLGCTPAVNLFRRSADPIRLTRTSVEYEVCPDARSRNTYEVHSIEDVVSITPGTGETIRFEPFYGVRHDSPAKGSGFWYARRRPSMRKGDSGSDIYLSLVDPEFDALAVSADVLQLEILCTNRGLPARLPFGDPTGDFQLEGTPGVSKIVALRKPSDPLPAPVASTNRWRLVSHLSLNYLSILDSGQRGAHGEGGKAIEALQEILRLYDFADSPVTRQRISGLVGVRTRRVVRRVGKGVSAGFARGIEAELEFDPSEYTGAGVFLFASVLERFLGLYTSINSFTQTVAKVRQRPGILKQWAPRAGEQSLL